MEKKMMINRRNYEVYFIDYYDGNLDAGQKKELFTFLEENPDLKAEFERFSGVKLTAEKIFFDKDKLKKDTITLYNYKTYFIAYFENDLNAYEKVEVEKFLEVHPGLQKEFELFRQTKVLPDNTIHFKNKNALKKGGKVIPLNTWIYRSAAVAASIAVVFLVFYLNRNNAVKNIAVTNISIPAKTNAIEQGHPVKKLDTNTSSETTGVKTEEVRKNQVNNEKQQLAVVEPLNKTNSATSNYTANKESQPLATTARPTVIINELPAGDTIQKTYPVFTDEELAELGLKEKEKEKEKEQSLLNKAAADLGRKVFGRNAKLENHTNAQDLSRTFAFAVGPFEFSRTTTR